jgi:hypothetical protein
MGVYDTLRSAINRKRCVRVFAEGQLRDICPQALGRKDGKLRLLAFQYEGGSVSGLAPGGQWRAFFLYDIVAAVLIDGPWHTGHNVVAKTEACLDRVDIEVH